MREMAGWLGGGSVAKAGGTVWAAWYHVLSAKTSTGLLRRLQGIYSYKKNHLYDIAFAKRVLYNNNIPRFPLIASSSSVSHEVYARRCVVMNGGVWFPEGLF
jgi:hypothetical protein